MDRLKAIDEDDKTRRGSIIVYERIQQVNSILYHYLCVYSGIG
jgi:hypothetical protein